MNRAIWKFPLTEPDVRIPIGATIISCHLQNEVPTLWAIVDPNAESVLRRFEILPTGLEFTKEFLGGANYIATLIYSNGLVGHVFEVIP